MKSEQIYKRQKKHLLNIFNQALSDTHPYNIVKGFVAVSDGDILAGEQHFPIGERQNVWVLGSGKASAQMALALEDQLGDLIAGGVIACSKGSRTAAQRIEQCEASHPFPDVDSVEAARKMMALAKEISPGDIVFYVMSGGSSALLCLPPDELSLESIQKANKVLLNSGANIHEMNIVRKHLSAIKGGRLASVLKDVHLVNLLISDVPGDALEDIGSGPTVPDNTTFSQAMDVLETYHLTSKMPEEVVHYLRKGADGMIADTYKQKNDHHHHIILGNAQSTAKQASRAAEKQGYSVYLASDAYSGQTHEISADFCDKALNVLQKDEPVEKPACLIFYGESYLEVKGSGKGGRNQEMALHASMKLDGRHHVSMLSAGTDGRDGPTDAAGAVCSGNTLKEAENAGINPEEYLSNNDSYHFFKELNSLVITGDTHNNVMDLQIFLIE